MLQSINRRLFACLLGLTLFAGGCASDAMVIDNARSMHSKLEPAVMSDPVLDGYVQSIGDRIVAVAREMRQTDTDRSGGDDSWMFNDVRFHLVNSQTMNAFTTGGQHVYLYTELFRACRTEDEFAAVVAHEFAHIYCRHVHNSINRGITIQALSVGAAIGAAALAEDDNAYLATGIAGVAIIGGQLVGLSYSRDDEDEADKVGFRFYVRAGWDPEQFAGFFQTMVDQGQDSGPNLLSSHPRLSDRVAAARRRAAELPPSAAQYRRPNLASPARFKQLQQRSIEIGKRMPSDQSLEEAQTLLAAFPSCVSPKEAPEQAEARRELLYEYGTPAQQEALRREEQQRQSAPPSSQAPAGSDPVNRSRPSRPDRPS
jgi:predicted Zn-dependent protease